MSDNQLKKRSLGKGSRILMLLFGLPFAGVGIFTGYLAFGTLWKSYQAKSWPVVKATIKSIELDINSGRKSTTHKVKGTYSYSYEGTKYTGDQITLYSKADNIGSFHKDIYNELKSARERKQSVDCRVNPNNPSESLLYPDFRWGMSLFYLIFTVTFGGVGFAIIIGTVLWGKSQEKKAVLMAQQPSQPWLHRAEWRDRTIKGNSGTAAVVISIIALIWNSLTIPGVLAIPKEIEKGNYAILVILLFLIIGVFLLYWAMKSVLQWRRFGRAVFKLQTLPAIPGNNLKGEIHLGADLPTGTKVTLKLIANSYTSVRRNNKTSTQVAVAWATEVVTIPSISGGIFGGAVISVSIPIDASAPPITAEGVNPSISWRLDATADIPGVDLHVQFDVPVFRN